MTTFESYLSDESVDEIRMKAYEGKVKKVAL